MNYPHNILMQVAKPARYTGGEFGAVTKDAENKAKVKINFCLCFPDVYEVGMSWSGLNILYSMLNGRDDTFCGRAFAPWPDMEKLLRLHDIPLKVLETGEALSEMDMLGFSLNHELSYTNFLNMLDLAGIPLLARDRGENDPIICVGGPSAVNPEPLADFVDFFFIGEAEAGFGAVPDVFASGTAKSDKNEFLSQIANLPGVYVPRFYDVTYNDDGTLKSFEPQPGTAAPKQISKAFAKDLDASFLPDTFITPNLGSVHDRSVLEVFRGCVRGCRFCQAGYIYRPYRERAPEVLLEFARKNINCTGYDEISLLSLSTGDYSRLTELSESLMNDFPNTSLSLPSLRVDAFSLDLMGRISGRRKSGLTFAPEAGSQRLRDVINKNLTEEEILEGCLQAFKGGWTKIKLYSMLGLPAETDEDIVSLALLADKVCDTYYTLPKEQRKKGISVNLSASCFVPKPHTPFQFAKQINSDELAVKQRLLKSRIRSKQIKFTYHDAKSAMVEGALARGDRRVGTALLEAFKSGARFDGWTEGFDFEIWQNAFAAAGLSMEFYARERGFDEILPWDHIRAGASKAFLIAEMKRAAEGTATPDCRKACAGCIAEGCTPPSLRP